MSDLGDRADDYERRLAMAGSTDAIIGGLVKGAERSKRSVRLLAITLIIDIVLSICMAGLALVAWHNASNVEANTSNLCRNTRILEQAHNHLVDILIINVKTSSPKVFSSADKANRIKNYESSRVPVEICMS